MSANYTYTDFANDVMGVCAGELELTDEVRARMATKAASLLAVQENKKAYNATRPASKSKPKGPSTETQSRATMIENVLTSTPMTAAEISAACGVSLTALQVSNACKYIKGVTTSRVVRAVLNNKGLRQEKEYTAYSLTA